MFQEIRKEVIQMTQATIEKRIRLTKRVISNTSGSKKERFETKLAYLHSLSPLARFFKGSKSQGEGGYR